MPVRKRVRGPVYTSGAYVAYGVTRTVTSLASLESCEDVTGVSGGGFPFYVNKFSASGGLMNGVKNQYFRASNCPVALVSGDTFNGHLATGALGLKTDSAYATEAQAKTNPSRPDIDIPVFIAELKDLPSLVQEAGGKVIKMMARHHLRTHFGIIPLVRDLISMCRFVQLTEQRMTELRALEKRGLSRTRTLDNLSTSEVKNVTPNSSGLLVTGVQTRVTTCRMWVHIKWNPSPGFPKTDASLLSLARRSSLGLTVDAATMWELIPFSWLADWFGSIGNYLAAKRNIVPCYPSTPQVMQHLRTETEIRMNDTGYPGITVSNYHAKCEYKSRRPTTITPFTAYVPFLSKGQLAVLGSLAVLKHGRYF